LKEHGQVLEEEVLAYVYIATLFDPRLTHCHLHSLVRNLRFPQHVRNDTTQPRRIDHQLGPTPERRSGHFADHVGNDSGISHAFELVGIDDGALTVRGYLNSAVKMGLISKPSRQTYGKGGKLD
jgi:hypothetical protein